VTTAADSSRRKAGDATRQRLLRAAERLFGRHGVDAVSLNEIVHTAGVNSAAIHYHFRTREGLITAILEQRLPMWRPKRIAMLEELERRPEITARDVVVAMVEPVAGLASYPWGEDYLNFLADISDHPRYAALVRIVGDEYRDTYRKLFEHVTPHLPDHIRLARVSYMHEFVYHALASGSRRVELWMTSIGEAQPTWTTDDFVDMITGAITAPVHELDARARARVVTRTRRVARS